MFGSEDVTREILGNVPRAVSLGFYLLTFIACGLAGIGFYRRIQKHRRGRLASASSTRWRELPAYLLFQKEIRRDPFAGAAHLLVTYGFIILFVGTCLVFLEHDTPLHFFYGWFYRIASLLIDLGGVAFLVGLCMFLWRRHVVKRTPILKEWWVASLTWLLFAIGISGFLLEGSRIARDLPAFERWSLVGYSLAFAIRLLGLPDATVQGLHRALWIGHAVLCVAFFGLLPWQFFSHMVYGAASWARRTTRRLSTLPVPPRDDPPGATIWPNLSTVDLLQTDACTTCGRCVEVCPASAAGKPLKPRAVVLGIRAGLDAGPTGLITDWVSDDALWSCTTCAACNASCPVGIDIYGKIVEMRRGRVETGIVPEAAEQLFESTAAEANPYGRSSADRETWSREVNAPVALENEPIELLYWVGCAGSFDPDGQSVARSMIKILDHLGVNYRVLGGRERCTGDPARRLGEEALFREQAAHNLDVFRQHRVRKIITHCPHCWNTFRNEYPALDADASGPAWTVQHHSEFLAEMIAGGRLQPAQLAEEPVTFHDPCYLARGNGVSEPPRDILRRLQPLPLVEMPRNRERSFCCGAGGGTMWVDVPGDQRVENLRAQEAAATGASVVVTGCPFCKVMLRTGLDASAASAVKVRDLAEMVVAAEGL